MKFGTSNGCQKEKKGQRWELYSSYSNCTTYHTTEGLFWSNWPICIHPCETFSWLLILIEETTPLWTVPFPERWSQLYIKQNKTKQINKKQPEQGMKNKPVSNISQWTLLHSLSPCSCLSKQQASKQHFPMSSASLPVSMLLPELLPLAPLMMGQIKPLFPFCLSIMFIIVMQSEL